MVRPNRTATSKVGPHARPVVSVSISIGSLARDLRARSQWVRDTRFRRTANRRALATSMGQRPGTNAPSSVTRSRSCSDSASCSSGMNQAIVAEESITAAATLPTSFVAVPLPFLPIERAEVHRLGEFADVACSLPCPVAIRSPLYGDKLSHGPAAPSDHDLLAALDLVEQCRKLVLGLERPDLGHHVSI